MNRPLPRPGLDALIHPRTRGEFLASYAASAPFVVHGLADTVRALTEVPALASLDVLLRSWPDEVQVHLPRVADEASAIAASPPEARALFDNGMGLRFDDAQRLAPELGVWLAAIRRELDLSALTQARCLVYATAAGTGTAPHFDQNVNFVLQLHGTKTWTLAANDQVRNPMTRHTIGLPVDPELQTYAHAPMPERMPPGGRAIVLEPGSLLFVPRGVWHATHATSDALSLNFTYSAPTWIDVLTAALRGRLAMSSAWRETAAPLEGERFEALLRELAEDVPQWTAVDILGVTEAADAVDDDDDGDDHDHDAPT